MIHQQLLHQTHNSTLSTPQLDKDETIFKQCKVKSLESHLNHRLLFHPNCILIIKKNLVFFQKVPVIFFSAAKVSKERKISEESDPTNSEKDNQHDSGAGSAESDSEDEIIEKGALESTEEDIELFKTRLGNLNSIVTNTANKIDKIQQTLDKVLENFRLGKPLETGEKNDEDTEISDQKDEENSENLDNDLEVTNSYEIFDREKLLKMLKDQKIANLKNPPRLTVGLIGYPNVGKSSTVNILMQTKKVSIFLLQVFVLVLPCTFVCKT